MIVEPNKEGRSVPRLLQPTTWKHFDHVENLEDFFVGFFVFVLGRWETITVTASILRVPYVTLAQ